MKRLMVYVVSKFTLIILVTYFFSEYLFASHVRAQSANTGYMRHDSSLGAPTDKRIGGLVVRAHELIGTRYRWGGASVSQGFDCSGLLFYLFRNEAGINIPRTTTSMLNSKAETVERDKLKVGDAVFFKHNGGQRMNHVGLYIGNGRFIHSPRTGKTIRIDSLNNTYWKQSYHTAKRFH